MSSEIPSGQSDGRVAWITGGGSGIGRALALTLARQGWRVWISGRRSEVLEEVAAQAEPGRIISLPLDVTRPALVRDGVARLLAQDARLDLAVLNAGDYRPMRLAEFDLELFHKLNKVNYLGAVNCIAAVLPPLLKQAHGQVLINASLSGYRGLPGAAPYGATKAALINLAESLRNEMQERGVHLRIVNPGFVRSSLTDRNDFQMPFLIEPEEAALAIVRRLDDTGFEITFPRLFALQMKVLRLLPDRLYFWLIRRFVR
jgi:NAD(P)-dependent dehydrogenase (short-subunit alcohol dehydrogenase family)